MKTQKLPPIWSRRQFLRWSGGATVATALSACTSVTAPSTTESVAAPVTDQPQRGGTLRVAFPGTPFSLDPLFSISYEEIHFVTATYEGLTWMDETGAVQPRLAESWEASEDGLSWTFHLRQGVQFHHGTPFTSADVVHNFDRLLNPDLGSSGPQIFSFIAGVEAVDDATVRINLHSPNVELLGWLSMWIAFITPHDRTDEEVAAAPTGTGPYTLAEFTPGEQMLLARNEAYWQEGLPYLDEVRMLYIPDTTAQIAALTSGILDVIWQVNVADVAALESNPDLAVQEIPSSAGVVIVMRTDQAPFDDVRVRQALKHCVDRPGMLQAVLQGRGTVGNDQIVGPDNRFWADVQPLEHDIEKAKTLLAEAGYANGLDLILPIQSFRNHTTETAIAFQEMVKPAGINIQLEQSTPGDFFSTVYMQAPFYVIINFPYPTFDIAYSLTQHSAGVWNETHWQNPELDALLEKGRVEHDEAKRQELYAEAQQRASAEGGSIVPFFRPLFSAARTSARNVVHTPLDLIHFHRIWLEQA